MEHAELIIDAHGHIGPDVKNWIPFSDAEGMLRTMDLCGVDKVCISSCMALKGETTRGNDFVHRISEQYPNRFIGQAVINPRYGKEVVPEMERCYYQLGVRYFKIHPGFHGYPANGENYKPFWEFADEKGLVVLCHVWPDPTCNAAAIEKVVARYGGVKLIAGHSGGVYEEIKLVAALARKYSNVYLDTAASRQYYGMVEYYVDAVGPQRVLFGSDFCFADLRLDLGRALHARVAEREKRDILGGNIRRLLEEAQGTNTKG